MVHSEHLENCVVGASVCVSDCVCVRMHVCVGHIGY